MIELYLIRHARAVERAADDWQRALEAEGRREARAVGAALGKEGVRFDAMAVSPLVRAVETATLVAEGTRFDGGFVVDQALTPEGSTDAMIAVCGKLSGASIALVGHEPSMGQLLSDLVDKPGQSLVKAGVVKIGFDGPVRRGAGKLLWQVSPRHLSPVRAG